MDALILLLVVVGLIAFEVLAMRFGVDSRDRMTTQQPPDSVNDEYNLRQPAHDVAHYLEPWSKVLEEHGYPPDEAKVAALTVLPDILRCNRAQPASYPTAVGSRTTSTAHASSG